MKITLKTLALISVYFAQTAIAVVPSSVARDVESECGSLGVMKLPDVLPAGTDLTKIRKCADHPFQLIDPSQPESNVTSRSTIKRGTSLTKRACEFGSPFGCSIRDGQGFCWKVCDSAGGWCWTAKNNGVGDWETCRDFNDCNTGMACGIGNCDACGCSC